MSSRTWLWLAIIVAGAILVGSMLATSRRRDSRASDSAAAAPLDVAKLASPQQLQGNLTVWSWNIAAKSLQSIVPAFRDQHPQVAVDVQMTGANIQTRFLLSLAAGTGAPDVMQLQGYEAPRYLATHRLTDLTAVAAKYRQNFAPMAWANCVDADGRVYAIPWDIGPCAVYYKPELFARYGVDPAKIETWDDFIEAGKTILRESKGQTKMLALNPGTLQQPYEMFLLQARGQVFDDQGRIAIDSVASRRVLELMRKMFDAGICANVTMFSSEWMAGLNDDRIATYPGAVWLGGTIRDTAGEYGTRRARWGVFPLPALERGGLRTSNIGGSVLVIPQQCAQKEAAWAFIEYALCTREGQVAQYRNYSLFPALLTALDDPALAEPDPFFGGQRIGELFASGIRGIPVLNRTEDWVEADNYLSQSLSAWAVNHEDSAAALATLSRKLERRLSRERSPQERP